MSRSNVSRESAMSSAPPKPGEVRLEVVPMPVSDIDRAKAFYRGLGWREDSDIMVSEDVRIVHFTPPGSDCSIEFGKGLGTMEPGSIHGLELAVHDIEAARDELMSRGVEVTELFHFDGGRPVPGPDPQRRSYMTHAAFSDPDGNGWLLQEITERLPGR
jgi:catechol 2,3-dioxygenase-like lactoylglutathione lyase family enzyme